MLRETSQDSEDSTLRLAVILLGVAVAFGLGGGLVAGLVRRFLSPDRQAHLPPIIVPAEQRPSRVEGPRGDSLDFLRQANPAPELAKQEKWRGRWKYKPGEEPGYLTNAAAGGSGKKMGGLGFGQARAGAAVGGGMGQSAGRANAPRGTFELVANLIPASNFLSSGVSSLKRRGAGGAAPPAGLAGGAGSGAAGQDIRAGASKGGSAAAAVQAARGMLGSAVDQGLLTPEQANLSNSRDASLASIEHAARLTRQAAGVAPASARGDAQLAVDYMDRALGQARGGDFRGAAASERLARQYLERVAAAQRAQGR